MIMDRRRLITLFSLLLAGCSSKVGTLNITVVHSPNPEQDPFHLESVSDLRVRVDAPGVLVGPEEFPINARSGTLSEVPVGSDREVTVEGLGPEGNVVSRGRTGPFEITSGDNHLSLYVGLMDSFSYINAERLSASRAFHTATLLTNGSVLISGGITGSAPWRPEAGVSLTRPTDSTELIDGNALSTSPSGRMAEPRVGHTATLLDSGNVLIAGGALPASSSSDAGPPSPDGGTADAAATTVPLVEVFQNGRFIGNETMFTPRAWHRAALTVEGVVLAGGMATEGASISKAELYRNGTLENMPGMLVKRRAFTLTTLADGTLVAAGGLDNTGKPLASTELYSPGSALWKSGPDLKSARAYHTATLLDDGTLLILGGLSVDGNTTDLIELYDPSHNTIRQLEREQQTSRWAHTATLLTDGRILVVGGFALNVNGSPIAMALEVQYFGGTAIQVKPLATLNEARAGHTATLLQSGMLLITGGISSGGPSRSAEVFVY